MSFTIIIDGNCQRLEFSEPTIRETMIAVEKVFWKWASKGIELRVTVMCGNRTMRNRCIKYFDDLWVDIKIGRQYVPEG